MAKLVDIEETQDPAVEDLPIEDKELETLAHDEVAPQVEEPAEPASDIPEKYQGKSVEDLVRMHQEAEKAIGKQGSEVGELRKIVDNFISNQPVAAPEPEPEVEKTDWYVDPDKALDERLESHPAIQEARAESERLHRQANTAKLQDKHPDYQDILRQEGFAQWIAESPVRTQLFIAADQKFDTDAADELFSNWKERTARAKETVQADKASRSEAVTAASTGGARGAAPSKAKPKLRRADIIELMNSDPDRYMAMQPEIMAAYREGRVIS